MTASNWGGSGYDYGMAGGEGFDLSAGPSAGSEWEYNPGILARVPKRQRAWFGVRSVHHHSKSS